MGALTVAAGRNFARAFTLVEVLVVLLLLGVAAAMLVPRLEPDARRTLGHETTRLAGALEHAVATAQWRGEVLGVSIEGQTYRFWRRDADGQWQLLAGDDVLAARGFPAGIEGRPETFAGAPVAPDSILPLRPSGRNQPYTIRLVGGDWMARIAADPLNRIAWTVQSVAAP